MTQLRTVVLVSALLSGAAQAQQGNFENPVDGSTESGIGVISGWHCTASQITIDIDGVSLGKAGSGTGRPDTTSVCGHPETGFSLLYNWNNLTPGQHTVTAHADGVLLGTKTINTVQSAGQQFARGISKTYALHDFPAINQVTTIEWREAKQNFVIAGTSASTSVSTPEVIESRIDGEFEGWTGATIFQLLNGQIWQQSIYKYYYHYAYSPRVLILLTSKGYQMLVDVGNDSYESVVVTRIR